MEKRILIAVVLSILVMLVYPLFLTKISPPPPQQLQVQQPIAKQAVTNINVDNVQPEAHGKQLPSNALITTIRTNRYVIDSTNIGGSINRIGIKDDQRLDMLLVDNAVYKAGIFAIDGQGVLSGLSSQQFEINKDTNSFYTERNDLRIEKKIKALADSYMFLASVSITNNSNLMQVLSFDITTGSNISNEGMYESRFTGADVLYKNGKVKRIASGNFKKHKRLYQNNIEWLALKNKYYSIIAKPEFVPSGVFTEDIDGVPVIGFIVDNEQLAPGQTKEYSFLMYIGPTELGELERADQTFSKALNFGILTNICLVLLSILRFFYGIFHNYGVAILLLTCSISLLLFPLSFKSLKSMKKLQEVQPHIEKIRTQHKDNPQKLNKAIMETYRRHKVNPMGGCLPMFLQMPIFIALYQTLMRSVELKGASFLWIKDLSLPDAAFHLPFSLPFLGNAINLLPILMIGAMIIQQKLSQAKTTASQTDQQKMMTTIMPVMFGFIFYSLPSGLVLYWLTNTLFTSSLQFFAMRKA